MLEDIKVNTCNFTFTHYEECLVKSKLYKDTSELELIHDIDHLTDNLSKFAEIEQTLGFKTKYFVRLHAVRYNALSYNNIKIFKELISKYNHEIGLHFEPSFYDKNYIEKGLFSEIQTLENNLDTKIKSFSIHSPLKNGSMPADLISDDLIYYCYNSEYYKDKKYISDSGGRWREGCMCQHIGKHPKLIILTHDLWWYSNNLSENY